MWGVLEDGRVGIFPVNFVTVIEGSIGDLPYRSAQVDTPSQVSGSNVHSSSQEEPQVHLEEKSGEQAEKREEILMSEMNPSLEAERASEGKEEVYQNHMPPPSQQDKKKPPPLPSRSTKPSRLAGDSTSVSDPSPSLTPSPFSPPQPPISSVENDISASTKDETSSASIEPPSSSALPTSTQPHPPTEPAPETSTPLSPILDASDIPQTPPVDSAVSTNNTLSDSPVPCITPSASLTPSPPPSASTSVAPRRKPVPPTGRSSIPLPTPPVKKKQPTPNTSQPAQAEKVVEEPAQAPVPPHEPMKQQQQEGDIPPPVQHSTASVQPCNPTAPSTQLNSVPEAQPSEQPQEPVQKPQQQTLLAQRLEHFRQLSAANEQSQTAVQRQRPRPATTPSRPNISQQPQHAAVQRPRQATVPSDPTHKVATAPPQHQQRQPLPHRQSTIGKGAPPPIPSRKPHPVQSPMMKPAQPSRRSENANINANANANSITAPSSPPGRPRIPNFDLKPTQREETKKQWHDKRKSIMMLREKRISFNLRMQFETGAIFDKTKKKTSTMTNNTTEHNYNNNYNNNKDTNNNNINNNDNDINGNNDNGNASDYCNQSATTTNN